MLFAPGGGFRGGELRERRGMRQAVGGVVLLNRVSDAIFIFTSILALVYRSSMLTYAAKYRMLNSTLNLELCLLILYVHFLHSR